MATYGPPLDDNRQPGANRAAPPSRMHDARSFGHERPASSKGGYGRPVYAQPIDWSTATQSQPCYVELDRDPGSITYSGYTSGIERRNEPQGFLPIYLCAAAWAGCALAKKHLISWLERLVLAQHSAKGRPETLTPWICKELAHETLREFIRRRGGLAHFSDLQARYALRDALHTVIARHMKQEDRVDRIESVPDAAQQSASKSNESPAHQATQLTSEHEEVLRLYEIERLTYHQIARRLGVSIGTIKSRLYRARRCRERLR